MPCKHAGGKDPCKRTRSGNCPVCIKAYEQKFLRFGSPFTRQDNGKATFIGEALVQVDLTRRGWEVTVPVSPTALHDLHVESPSRGWIGVQVKVGRLNLNTNTLNIHVAKGWKCRSPLLAVVHPPTGRIDYRAGTKSVPKELR